MDLTFTPEGCRLRPKPGHSCQSLARQQCRQSDFLCKAAACASCSNPPRTYPYPQAQAEALQAELRGARADLHRGTLELQVLSE